MAIMLTDLLDEKQVMLGLRSRKLPNALREIIDLLAETERSITRKRSLKRCSRASRRTPVWSETAPYSLTRGQTWSMKLSLALDAAAPGYHSATTEYAPI